MCYQIDSAFLLANMLRDDKREYVSLHDLLNAKREIENHFHDVLVDVSTLSLGSAIANYPALFSENNNCFYRAKNSTEYFSGTYVEDWFNKTLPKEVLISIEKQQSWIA